jgi:hypothetical protein
MSYEIDKKRLYEMGVISDEQYWQSLSRAERDALVELATDEERAAYYSSRPADGSFDIEDWSRNWSDVTRQRLSFMFNESE